MGQKARQVGSVHVVVGKLGLLSRTGCCQGGCGKATDYWTTNALVLKGTGIGRS